MSDGSNAEALLIGYTQDLDKDLVQAYSNTGVVHIIAISGWAMRLPSASTDAAASGQCIR